MTDRDWSRLPEQFAYVRPAAEEYDRLLRQHRHDRAAVEALTQRHIDGLARLYEEMDSRGDAERISAWLDNIPGEEKAEAQGVYWPVFRLFWVFSELAGRQIAPFTSGRVDYCPPKPPLDWSKLPAELQYLGKPAEKFGKYWGDAVEEFIESGSEEDKEELAALSERIRLNRHAGAIYAWVQQHYGMKQHPEAAMVAEMLNLMDEAGVPVDG